jgi:uncharacterized protein (DUF58 family)
MSFTDSFPGFRLRLTRWGAVFLAGLLVLGFAAVNTGNNALMALLGLALASYVVSGTWSRQVLGKVELRASVSGQVFAGRPATVDLEVVNRSRLFPAYGLVVRGHDGTPRVWEPMVAAGSTHSHAVQVEFADRGWTELGPWQLEVVLPLGFFVKSKRLLHSGKVLVYPRLLGSSSADTQTGGNVRTADTLSDRGREGDVVQLREYRDGDDRRQLHWKQTARQQRPIVVDRQRRSEKSVYLVLDPRLSEPDDPRLRERFEHLVSDVATGAVRRLERGEPVGLVIGGTVVHPVRSVARAGRLLRPLAMVQPSPADAPDPVRAGTGVSLTYRVEKPA